MDQIPPEKLKFMKDNITDNKLPVLVGVIVPFGVLCIILLGLRYYCRRISRAGWKLDDILSIVALFFTLATQIICAVGLHFGLGRHIIAVPRDGVILIVVFVFKLGMTFIKFSVLAYYLRLFPTTWFRRAVWVLFVLQAGWCIGFIISYCFICIPLARFWDPTIPGRCVNLPSLYWWSGMTNVISDVAILALPIPVIWNLKTTKSNKALLSGIFALGGFACAISVVRLILTYDIDTSSPNLTWELFPINFWSALELEVCYICSCLPTLGPLVRRIRGLSSLTSRSNRSNGGPSTRLSNIKTNKHDNQHENSLTSLAAIYREDRVDVESPKALQT